MTTSDVIEVAELLERSFSTDLTGPNRAGETDVAKVVRNELQLQMPDRARPLVFPRICRHGEIPTIPGKPERLQAKLAVVLTMFDALSGEIGFELEFSETSQQGREIVWDFLKCCSSGIVQPAWNFCMELWNGYGEGYTYGVATIQEFLVVVASNPHATVDMKLAVLDFLLLTPWQIGILFDGCPPDVVWECALFDKGMDVAGHISCPPHLAELTEVAT